MAKVLDYGLKVSLNSDCTIYIHFQTNAPWERYQPTYSSSYGLNSITAALLQE